MSMHYPALPVLSSHTLAVWRFVRDRGGYWTANEIGKLLGDDFKTANERLLVLCRQGHLARRPGIGRVRYGYTAKCHAPVGELAQPQATTGAMSARAEIDAICLAMVVRRKREISEQPCSPVMMPPSSSSMAVLTDAANLEGAHE